MKEKAFFKWLRQNHVYARTLSMILCLVIIFFAVPEIVYAETVDAISSADGSGDGLTAEGSTSSSQDGYAYSADIHEVVSLREENVKHFRLEDGSYVAAQYPSAVHTLDSDGSWQDIDNTLYISTKEFVTSDSRIKFAKKITGNETLFTLHNGNTKITMSLVGAEKGVVGELAVRESNT